MPDAAETTLETMRHRLQDLLVTKSVTPRALSLAIGANHSYVSQLLNGKGGTPSTTRIAAMARELGTSVEYLSGTSTSPDPVRSEVSVADRHLSWNGPVPDEPPIPLVGTGDCADLEVCGDSGQVISVERASFDPEYHVRYIARPPALSGARELYAIYFHGESMLPRFEPGEVGIVDPRRPVRAGDYVLVQLAENGDGEVSSVLVKRLVSQNSAEVTLEQFNPPLTFTVPKGRVARIHRIMQQTDLLF